MRTHLRSVAVAIAALVLLVAPTARAQVPLNTTTWTEIGPAPVRSLIFDRCAPIFHYGDRVVSIAAHPTEANTIYVATAGGGVWKTTGGDLWQPLTDREATLSMGAIALAPSNPLVIYAGTGDANGTADSFYGRGVLVSRDGGLTWTLRHNDFAFDRRAVAAIAVDPDDAEVAYVAVAANAVDGLPGNTGIWRTTDGGATWTNTTASITSSVSWSSVVIDPLTPSTLYAAAGDIPGAAQNGVYKSANGGASWTRLSGAPLGSAAGRITLAVSPSASHVIYIAAHGTGGPGSTALGSLYRFMRSDDGGVTFVDLTGSTPNYMGASAAASSLVVDPTNPLVVFAGGVAAPIRSADGGLTWEEIRIRFPYCIPTIFATLPSVFYAAGFDAAGWYLAGGTVGIHSRNPVDGTWVERMGDLNSHALRSLAAHPSLGRTLLAWSRAAALIRDFGPSASGRPYTWLPVITGGQVEFSRTNSRRVYLSVPNGSFWRSDCAGSISDFPSPICPNWAQKFVPPGPLSSNGPPIAVDPKNGDRVLLGASQMWETTNAGDDWLALGEPFPAPVSLIGLSPRDPNVTYVFAGDAIYLTLDHGVTWTPRRTVTGPFREIQVDPTDPMTAYAVFSMFNTGAGHVFRTTDGFLTWASVSGNLPDVPVWSLQVDAESPATLYVGTDIGVYKTVDGGLSWNRLGAGLPNVAVRQLRLFAGIDLLAAATYGRGAWEILATGKGPELKAHPAVVEPGGTVLAEWTRIIGASASDWIGLYRPGAAAQDFIDWVYVSCATTVDFFGGSGVAAGSCSMTLPSTLPPGTYELRLLADDGYEVVTTSGPFQVGAAAQLLVSPTSAAAGQPIVVSWSGIGSPTSTDWIGLYKAGAPATAFLDWIYVSCSYVPDVARPSGTCALVLPATLAPGAYELRVLANDGYTVVHASGPLSVIGPSGPSLSVMPTAVAPGGIVFATWSGLVPASPTDWIGLYRPGASPYEFLAWAYVSCSSWPGDARTAGTCGLAVPPEAGPGTYHLRLLVNDGFEVVATSNTFVVTSSP